MGVFQTLVNDPNYIQKYLKRVQTLKPIDILKVARKYLTAKNLNVTLMVHEDDSKTVTKKNLEKMATDYATILKNAQKKKVKIPKAKQGKKTTLKAALRLSTHKNPIVKHRLSKGGLVILKKNPEVPILSVKVGFLGGLRLETPDELGVTTLLSNTWTSGSMNFSEQKIASTIEGCAGSLSAFGGRNSVGLTLESLGMYKDRAWEVFSDVLRTPLFPQEAVDREKILQIESIKTRSDHPSSVVAQIFMENIFKGHPYAQDMLGAEAALLQLKSPKVFSHWEKMVSSQNAIFVAVGDFDEDKQLEKFEELARLLKPGSKQDQKFDSPSLEAKKVFSFSEKQQSHIIVGYRGLSFHDPDRYAIEVLQAILAGQGGRLFIELRDKASLAYTVAPVNMKGIETGYFGAYIGCSPEKGETAIKMIHQELEKICNIAPSNEEVERAKKYLVGRNHIDLQRNGAQASSILFDELYGIDCEETFKYAEHLKSLTAQDIQKLAQRLFKAPEVIAAVGPTQPW